MNPLYNHAEDRPFSPPPESKLAIDHPDYSPSIHCVPKRLFPEAHSKRKKPRARQRSSLSSSADEAASDGSDIRPLKLDFGQETSPSLDEEL